MIKALQEGVPFWVAVTGGVVGFFSPITYTVVVCLVFLLVDMYTAFMLSKRVKRKYDRGEGKFKSEYAKKVGKTFYEILIIISLAHFIDLTILIDLGGDYTVKIVAGYFLFVQGWSILENISSESDNNWSKPLQRIMTNKAARHFDVSEDEFKEFLRSKEDREINKEGREQNEEGRKQNEANK